MASIAVVAAPNYHLLSVKPGISLYLFTTLHNSSSFRYIHGFHIHLKKGLAMYMFVCTWQ
jgi:hypothetical protein